MCATAGTSTQTTPVVTMLAPGSHKLKLPPDLAWQRQVMATLQKFTSLTIVDRSSTPEPIHAVE